MMLTEVLPEALPDAQAVKGFFDSLTWQKVIPPLVLLLVGLVAVRLLLRLFDRALERSRLERAAYAMLRSVMKVLLYFILLLLVAAQLGVDVSSLVAILSVISLALSLAVQGALTNVVGGVTLLTTRPFKAGDFVELGDQSGTVLEVSVTYTKLQTPDNKIVSIPNSTAAAARITNFSAAGTETPAMPEIIQMTVFISFHVPPCGSHRLRLLSQPGGIGEGGPPPGGQLPHQPVYPRALCRGKGIRRQRHYLCPAGLVQRPGLLDHLLHCE